MGTQRFSFLILLLISQIFLSCDFNNQLNVKGPSSPSIVLPEKIDSVSESPENGSNLALLVTDPDSHWQDLASALKDVGIPTTVTRKVSTALKHQTVFAYPIISGRTLKAEELKLLESFVKNGGTLFATNVLGGGLQEVFGYQSVTSGRTVTTLTFDRSSKELTALLGTLDPEEEIFYLKNRGNEIHLGSTSYLGAKTPMALFEDKSQGLITNKYGRGRAYALGLDLGDLAYLGHSARGEELSDTFVNNFRPKLDVFLHLVKSIYRQGDKNAITLGIGPDGKNLVMLLTHDVDFVESVFNAVAYAKVERDLRINGTFFIQTKYVKDFSEDVFFSQRILNQLKQLKKLEMEIGSHSVSHSLQFMKFPAGDGQEQFPDYRPFVKDKVQTDRGTVLGELRISKFLLDVLVPQKTVSFRAGHLRNPEILPQLLQATFFEFDSSMTANASLTHLPVKLSYSARGRQMLPIYRFPVTIEDEAKPPLLERLDKSREVCTKISRRGGLCNVLIHPNTKTDKLIFVEKFIKAFQTTAWFGGVGEFGRFWSARDKVEVRSEKGAIFLHSPDEINGLTLELTSSGSYTSDPPNLIKQQSGKLLILRKFKGTATFTSQLRP